MKVDPCGSLIPVVKYLGIPVILVIVAANSGDGALTRQSHAEKHLLQLGWDQPDTDFLRSHWRAMEIDSPFDGLVLAVHAKHGARVIDENSVLDNRTWPRAALTDAVADLKQCEFTRFRHNFVRVNSTPGKLDWFNDAHWSAAASHLGHMAWLCRESKLKGVCFDPESYNGKQYLWRPEAGKTFAETATRARQRGRECMRAMAAEYPAITVWGLWLFSLNRDAAGDDSEAVLKADDYGLWPAFLNGWLDELPPQARLIDGMEHGFYFQEDATFAAVGREIRTGPMVARLVALENTKKYRTQTGLAFGLYLDAYLNPPGTEYALDALPGGARLDRLAKSLRAARATADEYVWLYNEQVRWWDRPYPPGQAREVQRTVGRGRFAEPAMPGLTAALRLRD